MTKLEGVVQSPWQRRNRNARILQLRGEKQRAPKKQADHNRRRSSWISGTRIVKGFGELGSKVSFQLVNAYIWESGRVTSYDFRRRMASLIPE